MTDEQAPDTPQSETAEVDRIRDIIFGSQMRDYDQRFQTVQRDLDRLQQDLDSLAQQLADQDSDQTKKTQSLRNNMRKADDDLRDELRQTAHKLRADTVDRATLGDLFIELGNQLKGDGAMGDLSELLGDLTQEES